MKQNWNAISGCNMTNEVGASDRAQNRRLQNTLVIGKALASQDLGVLYSMSGSAVRANVDIRCHQYLSARLVPHKCTTALREERVVKKGAHID